MRISCAALASTLLCFAANAASPEALAQDDADVHAQTDLFDMSLAELAEVKIVYSATKTETPFAKIPNKVVIITRDDIKRRNYKYLPDLLADLPGVHAYRRVQTEFGVETIVRGIFQNNKLLILWNGQKINEPSNKPYHFGNQISLDNAKMVEFIYGPASALYGADAVSGVINIVTDDFDDLGDRKGEVSASYGVDDTFSGFGQTGFKWGNVKGTLFAAYRQSDGPNFLDDYPSFYSGLRSPGFIAQGGQPGFDAPEESYEIQLKLQLHENTRLHVLHTDDSQSSAWGLGVPVFEFSEDNIWREEQTNIGLENETEVVDDVTLRSQLSYSRREVHEDSQFINSFFNNFESFTREDFKYERSLRFAITEELVYTQDKLQAVVGATYEDIDSLPKLSVVTGNRADPDLPLSFQTNPNIPVAEVSYRKIGVYGQTQYDITEDVNVLAGLRWDKVWDFDSFVNPRVGLTWSPTPTWDFRASYATATLTPAPYFLFENFNNVDFPGPNTIGALPNLDLEPEDYETYEAGVAVQPHENVFFDISVFYNTIDDYMLHQRQGRLPFTFVPAMGNTPAKTVTDAVAVFLNENGGDLESYGSDVTLRIKHGGYLDSWLYYSYLDGEQEETSTLAVNSPGKFDLALVSNHSLKGGVTFCCMNRKLNLTPYFVWTGNITTRPDNPVYEGRDMDGYFLLNLSLSYETERYRLWSLVRNMTDESYTTPAGTGGELDAPEQPQDQLAWYVGASLFF